MNGAFLYLNAAQQSRWLISPRDDGRSSYHPNGKTILLSSYYQQHWLEIAPSLLTVVQNRRSQILTSTQRNRRVVLRQCPLTSPVSVGHQQLPLLPAGRSSIMMAKSKMNKRNNRVDRENNQHYRNKCKTMKRIIKDAVFVSSPFHARFLCPLFDARVLLSYQPNSLCVAWQHAQYESNCTHKHELATRRNATHSTERAPVLQRDILQAIRFELGHSVRYAHVRWTLPLCYCVMCNVFLTCRKAVE